MSDAQFDPMPPPTYHPERSLLWAATSEMEQSSTRIPPAADAMNDARRMRIPIQDFRFGCSDGTRLHPHPAKHNHFSTRKRRRLRRDRSSPLSCPSWGLIRRYEGNFADTPPSFRPQYTDFAFAKSRATRPAQATPRSVPACRRRAAGSDVLRLTRASNIVRA